MTKTFKMLGAALDYANYSWLCDEAPDIAVALETEVLAGATPEEVRRFVTATIGDNRQGFINRVVSAARWLKGTQGG